MFKRFLLGLGLLGVVSSANASYIEIPAHYFKMSYGTSTFHPLERVPFKSFSNYSARHGSNFNNYTTNPFVNHGTQDIYSLIAIPNGVSGSRTYTTNLIIQKVYRTDTFFYKNNETIPIIVGCSNSNFTYMYEDGDAGGGAGRGHYLSGCTKVYPIVKSGQIDDAGNVITSTYDDTALKSENAILKAKVQALETKVYQCVQ